MTYLRRLLPGLALIVGLALGYTYALARIEPPSKPPPVIFRQEPARFVFFKSPEICLDAIEREAWTPLIWVADLPIDFDMALFNGGAIQ